MKISAFTYFRNGIQYGYPFVESIKSLLPLVDEYIVVIGDSVDRTREAVLRIGSNKIKIIDTIWDDSLREGGKIFAIQANIGLDNVSVDSDWLIHLQADEVIHEKDYETIKYVLQKNLQTKGLDGFLLRFINFYGDYHHYCPSRRFHQKEVRIIKNDQQIRSFKDSMGFRRFQNYGSANEKSSKLNVAQLEATVYHYSWARPPEKQKAKQIEFARKYNQTDNFIEKTAELVTEKYEYLKYDYLSKFTASHPMVMKELVASQDWLFQYNPTVNNMTLKEKFLKFIQQVTGKQFFIYKNYRLNNRLLK